MERASSDRRTGGKGPAALEAVGHRILAKLEGIDPWTDSYGLARTLLALAVLATLVANPTDLLIRDVGIVETVPTCSGTARISLFCLLTPRLELARWVAVAGLAVVATGWRPRLTGLLHWWLTYSVWISSTVRDGGDHVAAALTLLLIPVTLTDPRRWHWQRTDRAADGLSSRGAIARRILAVSGLVAVRLQVAGIYFHAATAKLTVDEWVKGTATYYYLYESEILGLVAWLRPVLEPVLTSQLVVVVTWGVLLVELALFTAIVMDAERRRILLPVGLVFHGLIAVMVGLWSFSVTMMAAVILYIRPIGRDLPPRARHLLPVRTLASAR